jgi:hypothetical protein
LDLAKNSLRREGVFFYGFGGEDNLRGLFFKI